MLRKLIGCVLALAIAMGMGRFAFTPILPAMQAATGLGSDQAGILASLNYLGYFLGALIVGYAPRGTARNTVYRLALVGSIATTFAMGLTSDFLSWSILRFVGGFASAGVFILAIAMTLDALVQGRKEGWSGWLYTGVGLGITVSGLIVMLFGDLLRWDGDWLVLGTLCAIAGIASWLWVADAPTARPSPSQAHAVTPGTATRWTAPLLLLTLAYFLEGGGYIITGTFLVAILKATPETAAIGELSWMIGGLAAMASGLLWSAIGRRIGVWQALVLAHIVQIASILLPLTGSAAAGVLSAILYGGTFVGIVSLTFTQARILSGDGSARVLGAVTAAYGLGQIIGPLPAGLVVEATGRYDAALWGAALVVAVAVLLLAAGLIIDRNRRLSV